MRTRQRNREPAQQPAAGPAGDAAALRAQSERLLAAGTDAIERALSGDSEAFLAASRQEGGQ